MLSRRIILVAIALACASRLASADPAYRVIVNADNPVTSISKDTLAAMLLKTKNTWGNGSKVLPVDQRVGNRPREAISRAVHGRSATAIKNWWNQQIFAGKGVPPPELSSDAKVIAFVTGNPGAIGYVAADANVGTAKVITLTD
jgi:ABC-type phosphate transport system substrate-binding protein